MGKVSGGAGRTAGTRLNIRRAAGAPAADNFGGDTFEAADNSARIMRAARNVEWTANASIQRGDTLAVRLNERARRLILYQNGRRVGGADYISPYDLNDVGRWARQAGVNLRWASTTNRNRNSRIEPNRPTLQSALLGTMYRG